MDIITNSLYWLTTGLLVPVIVLLLMFFIRSLLLGGSFYGQFINRSKNNEEIKKQLKAGDITTFSSSEFQEQKDNNPLMKTIDEMLAHKASMATLNLLIGEYEIIADKDLGKSKTLTKLGPMLGLMGTLIPMGPALVGLATGDVASMASNMQVAFATTVIGVFIGAVGFITMQVKQRWYADDMNTLDFIAGSIEEQNAHQKINSLTKNTSIKERELVYETE